MTFDFSDEARDVEAVNVFGSLFGLDLRVPGRGLELALRSGHRLDLDPTRLGGRRHDDGLRSQRKNRLAKESGKLNFLAD